MKLSFLKKHVMFQGIQHYIPDHPVVSNRNEITWITNSYVNHVLGGSEYMAHTINRFLLQQGFVINVIGTWESCMYEGIRLINVADTQQVKGAIGRSSLLFSQNFNFPERTVRIAHQLNKHVVVFIHTTNPVWDPSPEQYTSMIHPSRLHVIYNTEWVRSFCKPSTNSIVLRPPIDTTKIAHQTTRKYVTLVSVSLNKGAYPFFEIATRMPDVQFLGVNNIIKGPDLPNITYLEKTRSIKEIYEQSDIVLMPSEYESWGMVASEAIASGVPVIASPTPGLQENLAYVGLYIHQNAIDEWVSMIRKLKNDTEFYAATVVKCLQRAEELKAQNTLDFDRMKTFIDDIVR